MKTKNTGRLGVILKALAALAVAGGSAFGQATINWANGPLAFGNYNATSSWNGSVVPGVNDTIQLSLNSSPNNNGSFTINYTQSQEARALFNRTGSPSFALNDYTMTFNNGANATYSMSFDRGFAGGTTTFGNGTIENRGRLGMGGGTAAGGRILIFDDATLWNATADRTTFYDLDIGGSVIAGGTAAGWSSHTLTLQNSSIVNAGILRVGVGGATNANSNTVNVQGGSTLDLRGGTNIGVATASSTNNNNVLNVSGAGSVFKSTFVQVGSTASGSTTSGNQFNVSGGDVTIGAPTFGYLLVAGFQSANSANLTGGNVTVSATNGTGYLRATSGNNINIAGSNVLTDQIRRSSTDGAINFTSGNLTVGQINPVGDVATAGGMVIGDSTGGTATLNLGSNVHRFAGLTLNSDAIINFTLDGVSDYAYTSGTGALAMGGTLKLSANYTIANGNSFSLFQDFASRSGTFAALDLPTLGGGLSWDTSNLYSTGVVSVIPEPSTGLLLLISGAAAFALRRRRKA